MPNHPNIMAIPPGLPISSIGPSRNEDESLLKFSKETHSHFVHTPWQRSENTGLYCPCYAFRQHKGPAWDYIHCALLSRVFSSIRMDYSSSSQWGDADAEQE